MTALSLSVQGVRSPARWTYVIGNILRPRPTGLVVRSERSLQTLAIASLIQQRAEDHGILEVLTRAELLEVGHGVRRIAGHGDEAPHVGRCFGMFDLWDQA